MSKHKNIYTWRRLIQLLFTIIVVLIGIQFTRFVYSITNPDTMQFIVRPAGVEAFLPISALVALKSWLANGIFDQIHPAGLVILLAAMIVSLLWKRAFCSWICPFGTLSEGLALLGKKMFKRNFILPNWLDYPLRSLKYIILAFFVLFIFVLMDGASTYMFLQTPYNMVADIKMLDFFRKMTWVGFSVVIGLMLLSILIEHFWCRYLCPYGALLGLLGMLSPWKIRRESLSCISCERCSISCPNRIKVDKALTVWSPECTGCLDCVEQCPVNNTLRFDLPKTTFPLSPRMLALGVVVVWIALVGVAKLTGYWETSISTEMYKMLIPSMDQLNHF
ncbi:4Fe-4S binding protein [Desulfosporosinus shakirovi]|uniref:4Fe-4S binding protein n=1 Tax=Desulfosporosinus shakirovi TaxID=2885154 RepID=UPI001E3A69B8|nr:4Fe-4S binding protein [Desulfosporosinus sp. SRJS8]MCB8814524.1 4Fe-4S binding protein [Desulfosporosinus sp. SRJS8]